MSLRAKVVNLALIVAVLGLCGFAVAEVVQKGTLRIGLNAKLQPSHLPRAGSKPIAVSISSRLTTTDQTVPPPLESMRIELNRHGRLDTEGLPECQIPQIQTASSATALKACRPALVGRGSFSIDVVLGGQDPYPTKGRLLLFNGRIGCHTSPSRAKETKSLDQRPLPTLRPFPFPNAGRVWPSRSRTQGGRQGERTPVRDPQAADRGRRDAQCHTRPALLAQIYAAHPFANSFVIPFRIEQLPHGHYGIVLAARLPAAFTSWGHITSLQMRLFRRYRYRGAPHSFLSAGCPAPQGVREASFPLARASLAFVGAVQISQALSGSCRATR
jgi:hypothetical protein